MSFPLPFWLSLVAAAGLILVGWKFRRQAWGLPFCAVAGTVGVWYQGDALYNGYDNYQLLFPPVILEEAWWQVVLFLTAFGLLGPVMHRLINHRLAKRGSRVVVYLESGLLQNTPVQKKISQAANVLFLVWGGLMVIALLRVQGDFLGLFAPYLGYKIDPWGRGRLGGGFDAVLSLAGYLQIFLVAAIGVVAAVARHPRTRAIALGICFLSFPFYIFDRTRNAMLATILPGLLAWIFMRLRAPFPVKVGLLAGAFLLINFWFAFVLQNRTGQSIAAAFAESGAEIEVEEMHHLGLNMFEELAWINLLIRAEIYQPNIGQRYLAEMVNIIPRSLWPGKPDIGLDYAIARGLGAGDDLEGGVYATISTGMIGQGVVNFGFFFGPIAAAMLMAIWVSILARQDLLGHDPAHLLLWGVGMILTFNMGRDITLLVVYPYLFGWLLTVVWQRFSRATGKAGRPSGSRRRGKSRAVSGGGKAAVPRRLNPGPVVEERGNLAT